MKCLFWIEIDGFLDWKTQGAAHFEVKYCCFIGSEEVQKVSISGFLSENAPSVHPDIGHQIFLYKFLTFILPDLRINSPIFRVQKKLVRFTFGTRLQLEHVVLKGYGVVQK